MIQEAISAVALVNPRPVAVPAADEPVAFVGLADLDAVTAIASDSEVRSYADVATGYTPFEDGDILLAKITPSFENMKIGQASTSTKFARGSTEFHVIRPMSDVLDDRYLLHFLRQNWVLKLGALRMTGSAGQRRVPERFLDELEIPLPPIEEQRRIAAILDAADALRTGRREAIAKLGTLTQAIFVDMFGDPLALAAESSRTSLRDLVHFVGGGTPSKANIEYFAGDICWATSKDMRSSFLDDTQDHITEAAIADSATKLVPEATVLVVVKSKILAHRLPVAITRVPTCFGQDLKGLIPDGGTNAEFIAAALLSGQQWLLARTRGVNTEGLTLDELRRFPVPEASPSEMRAFQRLAVSVEERRRAALTSLAHLEGLFSSLQHRGFRGEL